MTPETFHAGPGLGRLSDVTIIHGDCLEAMAELEADSVDAIVTDPPYGLGFMGKAWDDLPPGVDWAKQCLRVLKPGGHLLAFGGTRTWHRLAVAVEDAGFEIRDSIAWLYGSGFPKSLDVSKAIDKAAGATRTEYPDPKWLDRYPNGNGGNHNRGEGGIYGAAESILGRPLTTSDPATPEAVQWSGWGTALKPAFEPIVVARKPLVGTVAANVLQHGTGALNIDGCRIGYQSDADMNQARVPQPKFGVKAEGAGSYDFKAGEGRNGDTFDPTKGRWPANVVLDADQAAVLDEQSGTSMSGVETKPRAKGGIWTPSQGAPAGPQYGDSGGASRFFFNAGPTDPPFLYCAKAPKKERPTYVDADGKSHAHPTVKPLSLMRWLVRLVTPPGGTVLDPFAGSGTTVEAALLEGVRVVGIERETDYLAMIQQRIVRSLDV